MDRRDRDLVANVLATSRWKHQHLDWQEPLDLLGQQPYLIAEQDSTFVGCLACPEEPSGVAWLRVVGIAMGAEPEAVWEAMWGEAARRLAQEGIHRSACLLSGSWQRRLLERTGFRETNAVIFFERSTRRLPSPPQTPLHLRPLNAADHADVAAVDHLAFGTLWRISTATLDIAVRQAAYASVAESEGRLVGYQITTISPLGAHLARLAVHPQWQGRGVGTALVVDMLQRLPERGAARVTLNTQADNLASQTLYRRLGFEETPDSFPVFELSL
ncbi:MAG TPA: GNAT family N-acetyltransferase [Anaerolineales bacterium]|nr:GNAT family N-acetyltransferase [Anaerolineales bacterium]